MRLADAVDLHASTIIGADLEKRANLRSAVSGVFRRMTPGGGITTAPTMPVSPLAMRARMRANPAAVPEHVVNDANLRRIMQRRAQQAAQSQGVVRGTNRRPTVAIDQNTLARARLQPVLQNAVAVQQRAAARANPFRPAVPPPAFGMVRTASDHRFLGLLEAVKLAADRSLFHAVGTPSEAAYRESVVRDEAMRGMGKGLAVGSLVGLGARRMGAGRLKSSLIAGTGAVLGREGGARHGESKVWKDIVGEERKRRDHVIRKNKELDDYYLRASLRSDGGPGNTLHLALPEAVEKTAFVGALGGAVTRGIGRGLGAMARSGNATMSGFGRNALTRYGAAVKSGRNAMGGTQNFNRAVGAGTLALGGGAVAGSVLT